MGSNIDEYMKETERGRVAGAEFGRTTDQNGCVENALVRSRDCGPMDMSCQMFSQGFLPKCLETAEPVAGLCDGVPGPNDFAGSIRYRTEYCAARVGPRQDQQAACQQVAMQIQFHCTHAPSLRAPTPDVD